VARLALLVLLAVAATAGAQDLTIITGVLEDADTEIRTGIFPAVSAILGALVLIGAAGGVVAIITRRS
jgi:hypothetical protein